MWEYKNKNPFGRQVNDCVVRAISLAEDREWDDVYQELTELARQEGTLLDDVTFVEPYLNDKYKKVCYRCKTFKTTLGDFIKSHQDGIFLVTMKGHITCVMDGVLYDTWDCRKRNIWCVWKVE
jgi:hypothetical protein